MLKSIANIKHRARPKPKRGVHPWRGNNEGWLKSQNEPYKDYLRETHDKRIQKSMKKDNRGQRVFAL